MIRACEEMDDEPADEELPEHRPVARTLVIVALLAIAGLIVYGIVAITKRGDQQAVPQRTENTSAAPTTPAPSPTLSIPPDPTSAPEQDAQPALNACGGDCVSYALDRRALQRTGMRGLSAAFGLRVTDGRDEQLRSIVGHVGAVQVRLLYERVDFPEAALRVTDSQGPGRTVVLAVIRGGWRLTAVLVGDTAPVASATAWARSAPLPH